MINERCRRVGGGGVRIHRLCGRLLVTGPNDHVAHKLAVFVATTLERLAPPLAIGRQVVEEELPEERSIAALIGTSV